ncbi:MAG: ATPase, partial [Cyanobacteria bacterium P01_H01_bin.15]
EGDADLKIGSYITLGPVGTAFLPSSLPRVLLVDEIDKSDINLPNDLLNLFEEGEYAIPELKRWLKQPANDTAEVFTEDRDITRKLKAGVVGCQAFPIVVMTSNGERDFPPAFKRRCIRINMPNPREEVLKDIVKAHIGETEYNEAKDTVAELVGEFVQKVDQKSDLATDQLLNVIYMLAGGQDAPYNREELKDLLFKSLSESEAV